MVCSTLADKALLAHRLQNSLHNTSAQLELEKAYSLAKDIRIKSLEEIIMELGNDPKDPKGIQALINKKEEDIAALRKQLRLPITMHPQTIEVAQQKEEEDVVNMLMRMNERLLQTEKALETVLQQKQGEVASRPLETAPIHATAPPTVTTTVLPTDQPSTVGTSTTAIAIAGLDTRLSMEDMMKEIKPLELQMAELKEAKEKLARIEVSYDKSKITVAEKTREVKALEKRIKELEKDLTLHKTLAEIKTILWTKIGQSITDQWQSIQTIHDQIELIGIAQFETQKARALLAKKLEQTNRLIHFLNTHTRDQLAALDIQDINNTILKVKKVLTMRNFV